MTTEHADLTERLAKWTKQKKLLLGTAANHALLPSLAHPKRDLFLTHFLVIDLEEDMQNSRGFNVSDAYTVPREDVINYHPSLKQEYENIKAANEHRAAVMAGSSNVDETYVGTSCTLLACGPLTKFVGTYWSRGVVDYWAKQPEVQDWRGEFMNMVSKHKYHWEGDYLVAKSKVKAEGEPCERTAA